MKPDVIARLSESITSIVVAAVTPLLEEIAALRAAQPSEVERLTERVAYLEAIHAQDHADLTKRAENAEADLAAALNTIALDQGTIRVIVEERDLFKAAWEASADVAKKAVEDMAAERIKRKDAEAKIASPPAPSGWQQRIAAMSPWGVESGKWCIFCGVSKLTVIERGHLPHCLWQNAKDALPPAIHDRCHRCGVGVPSGDTVCDRCYQSLLAQGARPALPPAPEGSPPKEAAKPEPPSVEEIADRIMLNICGYLRSSHSNGVRVRQHIVLVLTEYADALKEQK